MSMVVVFFIVFVHKLLEKCISDVNPFYRAAWNADAV